MGIADNFTQHAVAETVARDAQGRPTFVVVIKATFAWTPSGELHALASGPVQPLDEYAGPPATSGLIRAGELGPPKPRVDVLLAGEMRFPAAVPELDVALEVGTRIRKIARVFGPRRWLPGLVRDLSPTRPEPIAALPIAWEHSCGGADPSSSRHREARNPAGRSVAREARALENGALPNLEDPRDLLRSWTDRPAPMGFGAISPHWEARVRRAGTYDERWRQERAPLLPLDFDPAFWNSAPADQQLDGYVPGEEVRLVNMTPSPVVRFRLPGLAVPVTFMTRTLTEETSARVDTVVIEPAAGRVSILARASCVPSPSPAAIVRVIVGPPTRGFQRALRAGKQYVSYRRRVEAGRPS